MASKEYHREWKRRNAEKSKASCRRYYAENREAILAERRAQRRDPVLGESLRASRRQYEQRYMPQYRAKPESKRLLKNSRLRCKYGITLADFDQMLAAQNSRCALCRSDSPGGQGRWKVDHDHFTGKVRGLLCFTCNVGLGQFKDDVALMGRAIAYIARHAVQAA